MKLDFSKNPPWWTWVPMLALFAGIVASKIMGAEGLLVGLFVAFLCGGVLWLVLGVAYLAHGYVDAIDRGIRRGMQEGVEKVLREKKEEQ